MVVSGLVTCKLNLYKIMHRLCSTIASHVMQIVTQLFIQSLSGPNAVINLVPMVLISVEINWPGVNKLNKCTYRFKRKGNKAQYAFNTTVSINTARKELSKLDHTKEHNKAIVKNTGEFLKKV